MSVLVCASNVYPCFEAERIGRLLEGAIIFDPATSRDVTWDLLDLAYSHRPQRIVLCGTDRIDPPLVRELGATGSEVLVIAREADRSDLVRLVSILHWAARTGVIGTMLFERLHVMGAPRLIRLAADAFAQPVVASPAGGSNHRCLLLTANARDQGRHVLLRLRAQGHLVPGLLRADRELAGLAACHELYGKAGAVIDLDALRGRAAIVDMSLEAAHAMQALPRDRPSFTVGEDLRELAQLVPELLQTEPAPAIVPAAGLRARDFLCG